MQPLSRKIAAATAADPSAGRRVRRPSRIRRGLVPAALCALALTACGTESPGGEGSTTVSDDRAGAGSSGLPRTEPGATEPGIEPGTEPESPGPEGTEPEDTDTEGPDFIPFMELMVTLAEPCLKNLPTADLDAAAAPESAEPQRKDRELSGIEKCVARIHTSRITKALATIPDPAPHRIKQSLRDLGYIDERIHGPQRSGKGVEFTLDLRLLGGGPCMYGTVTGTRPVIESYGAYDNVDCTDARPAR